MHRKKIVVSIVVLIAAIAVIHYYLFQERKGPEIVETIPISKILDEKDLIIYMSRIDDYKINYTYNCSECHLNLTVRGYFILFKKPLPFIKDGARLAVMNVTIVYSQWPLEGKIADSILLGLLADKPIKVIPATSGGGAAYLVTYMAYAWIGVHEGFNDIKPGSKVFTFNLDSSALRTGGGTKGKYPENLNAVALVVRPPYPPAKIERIDLRNAYIAYVKG